MNEQIPIGADYRDDAAIDIHSIFQTIQGEGPFSGERALFIRLFGCNLRCPGCDTEYTSNRFSWAPLELVTTVQQDERWPHGGLIVLTGGEPFRQNVVPTIHALITVGYRVQVETNGVLAPPGLETLDYFRGFTIVCSPKTSRINPEIGARAAAFKYVIQAGETDDDGLPLRALEHPAAPHVARPRMSTPVYIQAMDEQDDAKNAANMRAAVESAMKHGYTLQVQIHKVLGLE